MIRTKKSTGKAKYNEAAIVTRIEERGDISVISKRSGNETRRTEDDVRKDTRTGDTDSDEEDYEEEEEDKGPRRSERNRHEKSEKISHICKCFIGSKAHNESRSGEFLDERLSTRRS